MWALEEEGAGARGVSQWWQGVVAGCPKWWCVGVLSLVGALYGGGDRLE